MTKGKKVLLWLVTLIVVAVIGVVVWYMTGVMSAEGTAQTLQPQESMGEVQDIPESQPVDTPLPETQLQEMRSYTDVISLDYADDQLISSGNYQEFIAENSEYLEKIAFNALEPLSDVQLYLMKFEGEKYEIDKKLYELTSLTPDQPLVVGVVFYGDLTTYAVSFKDSNGQQYQLAIYVSGKDGSLIVEEY